MKGLRIFGIICSVFIILHYVVNAAFFIFPIDQYTPVKVVCSMAYDVGAVGFDLTMALFLVRFKQRLIANILFFSDSILIISIFLFLMPHAYSAPIHSIKGALDIICILLDFSFITLVLLIRNDWFPGIKSLKVYAKASLVTFVIFLFVLIFLPILNAVKYSPITSVLNSIPFVYGILFFIKTKTDSPPELDELDRFTSKEI